MPLPLLDLATRAAKKAAALLQHEFLENAGVEHAAGKDIKTLADRAAQAVIIEVLAESGLPVLAEEGADPSFQAQGRVWLIDPLDGTMNFVRGFPMACVSIGLWEDGHPVLGVIVDLAQGEVYRGTVGLGAWLDEKPIRVSPVRQANQAILACGFPSGRNYDDASLGRFVTQVQSFKKIRMLGSAAMMLAQVAAGRFDAYYEEDIYWWDVAAGLALVQAAGGSIFTRPGSKPHALTVLATNGRLAQVSENFL